MRSFVLLFLLLGACTSNNPSGSDAGSDGGICYPVVHVCVTGESGGPAVGATVTAERPGDAPAMGTTGADGCVELDLPEGTWSMRGNTASLCGTPTVMVEVPACGTVEQPLMALSMLCVDGTL